MLLSGCSYDRKATFFMEYSICGLFAESEAHILDLNEKLPCSKQWHVHHNIVQLCFYIESNIHIVIIHMFANKHACVNAARADLHSEMHSS